MEITCIVFIGCTITQMKNGYLILASDEILTGITGDPMWADNCEDVAFNTYPAAVMPDFKSLRYLTAPNMVISSSKNHAPGIQN